MYTEADVPQYCSYVCEHECVCVCVAGIVWLVSNQGLLTRLVNTLTKIEPKHDPVPKPRTPQTRRLRTPESRDSPDR